MDSPQCLQLTGTCTLLTGGKIYPKSICELDSEAGTLNCHLEVASFEEDLYAGRSSEISIRDLVFHSPSGDLCASEVSVSFASGIKPPSMNIYRTQLQHTVGIDAQSTVLKLVLNRPLQLVTTEENHETIFLPSIDSCGTIAIEDRLLIRGGKKFLSVEGESGLTDDQLALCISVLVGAPAFSAISQKGNVIQIHLNHFNPVASRPMFSRGDDWIEVEKIREGAKQIFVCTKKYILSLSPLEYAAASNAINTFMQTRSSKLSFELKLLGTFYFLEWLDGTKRMSPNELAALLEISRAEADQIKYVRDQLVHNRLILKDALENAVSTIQLLGQSKFNIFDTGKNSYSFVNYIITLVTAAFLRKIGFSGKVDNYLPIGPFQ